MCPFNNRLSFLEVFRKIFEKLKSGRADFLLWSEKSFKTSTEAFWSPQVTRHERILFGYIFTIIKESFLYVCMVNTIYLLSVETPRKFIIAELSIRKLDLHQYY